MLYPDVFDDHHVEGDGREVSLKLYLIRLLVCLIQYRWKVSLSCSPDNQNLTSHGLFIVPLPSHR